jgi:hypothetical protein
VKRVTRRPATPKRLEYKAIAGSKGGKTSSANMTAAERKARAQKAIAARWAKRKQGK